jgi:hypothetical protein
MHAAFNNADNYHRNWNVTRIMIILIYGLEDVVIPETKASASALHR